MARRHSEYARLRGTVQNDPKPLIRRGVNEIDSSGTGLGVAPGWPSLPARPNPSNIGDELGQMSYRLAQHCNALRGMSETGDFTGIPEGLSDPEPFGGDIGLPSDFY